MNTPNIELYKNETGALFLLVKTTEPTNPDKIISSVYSLSEENKVKQSVNQTGQDSTPLLLAEIGILSKVIE